MEEFNAFNPEALALHGQDPYSHDPIAGLEVKVARKRSECANAIPEPWRLPKAVWESLKLPLDKSKNNLMELDVVRLSGILTEAEIQITESYDVPTLLEKLGSGDLSSVEVTRAFSKRAAIAQQLTNCLTETFFGQAETFFGQAETRARELDALRESGKLAGPLHGLPISFKDTLRVTGTQADEANNCQ
ncbi:hypothetical protein NW759_016758 [Fusarium solani]|nr:hypothetical protein NW759_016758 [Fusarium solani]